MPNLDTIYQGIIEQITSDNWFQDLIWDPYYDQYWSETGYSDANSLWSSVGGMFSNMLGSEFEALDSIANLQINNTNDAFSLYVDNQARSADLSARMNTMQLDHLKENTHQQNAFKDQELALSTNAIVDQGVIKAEGAAALIGKSGLSGGDISQTQDIINADIRSQVENARMTRQFARSSDKRKIAKAELNADHVIETASAEWDAQYGLKLQSHRNKKENIAFDLTIDKLNLYDQWASEQVMSANRLMDSGFGLDYACPDGWYPGDDGVCIDGGIAIEGSEPEGVPGCMTETDANYNPDATVHNEQMCEAWLLDWGTGEDPGEEEAEEEGLGTDPLNQCGPLNPWCETIQACTSWENCNGITEWISGGNTGPGGGLEWDNTCICTEEGFGTDQNGNWCTCELNTLTFDYNTFDTINAMDVYDFFVDLVDSDSTGEFLQDMCTGAAVWQSASTGNLHVAAVCLVGNLLNNFIPFWDTLGDIADTVYCGTFGKWFGDSGCDDVPTYTIPDGPYAGKTIELATYNATCQDEDSELYDSESWICSDYYHMEAAGALPGGYHLDCTSYGGHWCSNGNCIGAEENCNDYPCPPGYSDIDGNCLPDNWQEILVGMYEWNCGDGYPCPLEGMTCYDGVCHDEGESGGGNNYTDPSTTTDIMGCTDPSATNYDSSANVDDGSCISTWETCSDDNACPPRYECVGGGCVPIVECEGDGDCSGYNVIEDGELIFESTCGEDGLCTLNTYPDPFNNSKYNELER